MPTLRDVFVETYKPPAGATLRNYTVTLTVHLTFGAKQTFDVDCTAFTPEHARRRALVAIFSVHGPMEWHEIVDVQEVGGD